MAPPTPKFPAINDKLAQPKKLSTFERERQEAESKRLREAVKAQKALHDFEEEFAGGDDDDHSSRPYHDSRHDVRQPRDVRDPRDIRHGRLSSSARDRGLSSGRPTFGPRDQWSDNKQDQRYQDRDPRGRSRDGRGPRDVAEFGLSGPPPSLKRKREGQKQSDEGWGEPNTTPGAVPGFGEMRNEEARSDVRRPTALLHHLPAGTSEQDVRDLMSILKVEDVVFITSDRREPSSSDRPARKGQGVKVSALVIAGAHTPVSEVDNAVSTLSGKYLGFGCYLKISRHISLNGSQAPRTHDLAITDDKHPFGARPRAPRDTQPVSLRNAPPPRDLECVDRPRTSGIEVTVKAPTDLKALRLIHRTAEKVLLHGPEFEALLMSTPAVQHDEKWAWLYDPTLDAAVYYRWSIFSLARGISPLSSLPDNNAEIFDSGPIWTPPQQSLQFAQTQVFEDLVHDSAYASSDDEAEPDTAPGLDSDTPKYLNPYRRARLTHLLARLPESIAFLRAGDVARVTSFAVSNAGHGVEEIVDCVLSNIENPYRGRVVYDHYPEDMPLPATDDKKDKDPSAPKLIALYVLSDILQASSVSGVKDAWKYRTLFEGAISERKIFRHLGGLERTYDWGRMKAEQWKRKIGFVLGLWEGRSIFPKAAMERFKAEFECTAGSGSVDGGRDMKSREESGSTVHTGAATGKWKESARGPLDNEANQDSKEDLVAQKIATIKAKAAAAKGVLAADVATSVSQQNAPVTSPGSVSQDSQAKDLSQNRHHADASSTAVQPGQAAPVTTKRYRPTAVELIDAKTAPAQSASSARSDQTSVQTVGSPLGFSLSGSQPSGIQSEQQKSSAVASGFSLGGSVKAYAVAESSKAADSESSASKEKSALDDMFDSD